MTLTRDKCGGGHKKTFLNIQGNEIEKINNEDDTHKSEAMMFFISIFQVAYLPRAQVSKSSLWNSFRRCNDDDEDDDDDDIYFILDWFKIIF